MARRAAPKVEVDDVYILPPFQSRTYTVVALFDDDTSENIHVMAKGRAMAFQTACYSISRLPPERIAQLVGMAFDGDPNDSPPKPPAAVQD